MSSPLETENEHICARYVEWDLEVAPRLTPSQRARDLDVFAEQFDALPPVWNPPAVGPTRWPTCAATRHECCAASPNRNGFHVGSDVTRPTALPWLVSQARCQ
jgi:hypothetical protein